MSYFCNIKGQTRQARWLLTNLTFYNQISEFFSSIIICVKSRFNLSRFYFKFVLKDESYIILGIYHHFLHKATPKSLIEFFYQSTLLFQCTNESLEQLPLCFLSICSEILSYSDLIALCFSVMSAYLLSYSFWSSAVQLFSAMSICICSAIIVHYSTHK